MRKIIRKLFPSKEEKPRQKICVKCGKKFENQSSNYCSTNCATNHLKDMEKK